MGVVHCEFKGLAFYKVKGKAMKLNLRGRTIIDAASFKEFNANYASVDMDPDDPEYFARRYEEGRRYLGHNSIKKKALQPTDITDDEAYLCSPTVQGFSLRYVGSNSQSMLLRYIINIVLQQTNVG